MVNWRITVDDMTSKMEVQSNEMRDLQQDIDRKAVQITDLEAQLWQSEQGLTGRTGGRVARRQGTEAGKGGREGRQGGDAGRGGREGRAGG